MKEASTRRSSCRCRAGTTSGPPPSTASTTPPRWPTSRRSSARGARSCSTWAPRSGCGPCRSARSRAARGAARVLAFEPQPRRHRAGSSATSRSTGSAGNRSTVAATTGSASARRSGSTLVSAEYGVGSGVRRRRGGPGEQREVPPPCRWRRSRRLGGARAPRARQLRRGSTPRAVAAAFLRRRGSHDRPRPARSSSASSTPPGSPPAARTWARCWPAIDYDVFALRPAPLAPPGDRTTQVQHGRPLAPAPAAARSRATCCCSRTERVSEAEPCGRARSRRAGPLESSAGWRHERVVSVAERRASASGMVLLTLVRVSS